ncbi:MAG: hypothetical protein V4674_04165 [Patescibacteria group bacterium]
MASIPYPFIPPGRTFLYVPSDDRFMGLAREAARRSTDPLVKTGAVVVSRDGSVLGVGANYSAFHEEKGCERKRLGCKTGEGYELCEGCSPAYHAEPSALRAARESGNDPDGASLYLWGHWWACKDCWSAILEAGIERVYLLERSEELFNREHPHHILGKQFGV